MINSYLPVDKNDFDENELLKTMNEITWLCDNCEYDHVLLASDMNTDFSRNTEFVRIVRDR